MIGPLTKVGWLAEQVLDEVLAKGANPNLIRVISVVCAPPALSRLAPKFPGTEFQWTAGGAGQELMVVDG